VLSAATLAASCPVDDWTAATVGKLVLDASESCNDATLACCATVGRAQRL